MDYRIVSAAIILCLTTTSLVYSEATVKKIEVGGYIPGTNYLSYYYEAHCTCTCGGKEIKAVGLHSGDIIGDVLKDRENEKLAIAACEEQCAKSCSQHSSCADKTETGCSKCCENYCSKNYAGGDKTTCKTSCESKCTYKGLVYGITDIIYFVAGIVGGLMIVVHGVKMITSTDPSMRNAAKKSILYVFAGLFIISLAVTIATYFLTQSYGEPQKTPVEGNKEPKTGCGDCNGKNPCTEDACEKTSGCWFSPASGGKCLSCSYVSSCADYDSVNNCEDNPCKISSSCIWENNRCIKK